MTDTPAVPSLSTDCDDEYATPVVRAEFVATFNRIDVVSAHRARTDTPLSVTAPRTLYVKDGEATAAAGRSASCHAIEFVVVGDDVNEADPEAPAEACTPFVAIRPVETVVVARDVHPPGTPGVADPDPSMMPPTRYVFATVVVTDGAGFGVGYVYVPGDDTFTGSAVSTPRNLAQATAPGVDTDSANVTGEVDVPDATHANTVTYRSPAVISAFAMAVSAVPEGTVTVELLRWLTATTNTSFAWTPASGVNENVVVDVEKGELPAAS